jgi:DNA-directed RNA polymerase subunit L
MAAASASLDIPTVSRLEDANLRGEYVFQVSNVDVSVMNALRRVILSDLPVVVIRTFPDSVKNPVISENTTRMHNEIIKQRLACIPVFTDDLSDAQKFDLITKTKFKIQQENNEERVTYVTTQHIDLESLNPADYDVPGELKSTLFPISKLNGQELGYIDIVRLRPPVAKFQRNQQETSIVPGDKLHLEGRFAVGCARQFSGFNVASTVVFTNVQKTPEELDRAWEAFKAKPDNNITPQNEQFERNNWNCLQAKREVVPNRFEFRLKPLGNAYPKNILRAAFQVLREKLAKIKSNVGNMINAISDNYVGDQQTTIRNAYEIHLVEQPNTPQLGDAPAGADTWEKLLEPAYEYVATDAYTIGKLLEYALYALYVDQLSFCGFDLPHPHSKKAVIRIAFNRTASPVSSFGFGGASHRGGAGNDDVQAMVENAIDAIVVVLNNIETGVTSSA